MAKEIVENKEEIVENKEEITEKNDKTIEILYPVLFYFMFLFNCIKQLY